MNLGVLLYFYNLEPLMSRNGKKGEKEKGEAMIERNEEIRGGGGRKDRE